MTLAFFLLLSLIALGGGVAMVMHPNPVTSALSLAVSFLAVAGLYLLLDAELLAIFQVLVYAGAIMVLFLFIIMLLDVKGENRREYGPVPVLAGLVLSGLFLVQLGAVLLSYDEGNQPFQPIDIQAALEARIESQGDGAVALPTANKLLADGDLPDAHLLGEALFDRYLLPLQVIGVLLLVSSVGVVALTKRHGTKAVTKVTE